ncbi:hypothetical protein MWN33_14445 [Starkeya koreensis]|uniref:Uncharacterized protein n=1 Tax=Ancylobacter koreensis TaxID=266121 RepID=A0ABT0DPM1_9HYPH|nr:hypothetical protein [Ancylobacter koreensis]MCK0209232.1 hypothetical protein [Ancylobacter koreensis]
MNVKTFVGAALAAALLAAGIPPGVPVAAAQAKPAINMGKGYYQGRWVWNGALRSKRDPNNISFIQFVGPSRIVYTYNKAITEVNVRRDTGNGFAFTTNGRNQFVLIAPSPGRLNAAFWEDFASPSRPPDAVAGFMLKP